MTLAPLGLLVVSALAGPVYRPLPTARVAERLASVYLPGRETFLRQLALVGPRSIPLGFDERQRAVAAAVRLRAGGLEREEDLARYEAALRALPASDQRLALRAGVLLNEYAARLAEHVGPLPPLDGMPERAAVDPAGFFTEAVGKKGFPRDQLARERLGRSRFHLPDRWNVVNHGLDAATREAFLAHRSRYEAVLLHERWAESSSDAEAARRRAREDASQLEELRLEPGSVARPAGSGEFGVVYRVDGERGPIAVKVPLGYGDAWREARRGAELSAAFRDPEQRPDLPRPDNVDLVGLLAAGLMDLRALTGLPDPEPAVAPALWLDWGGDQSMEELLRDGGSAARADWEGLERGVARLHALGYAHDDLRGRNVGVRFRRGRAFFRLLDYGSARRALDHPERFKLAVESDLKDLLSMREQLERRGWLAP